MSTQSGTIAIISPRYPPAAGGVEKHVEALARGLVERNIPVEVITTDPTGQLPVLQERNGVLVRRFPTVANDSIFFVAPQLGSWLMENAGRFSVIHAHSYHTPLALQAAWAAKKHQIPFVVTPHYHGTGHSPLRQFLHVPYRTFGAWMVRRAERVICVSSVEAALIREHFGKQIPTVVLPNGIETSAILQAEPYHFNDGNLYILSVGRLEKYKQVDRLIHTLPELPDHVQAVIIGIGPEEERLKSLAESLQVSERVRFLGHVTQAELLAWYRSAHVCMCMSQHEAFGITVLEAAVAGTPVIASAIPAHQEVCGYVPAGRIQLVDLQTSPSTMASAIMEAAQRGRTVGIEGWSIPTWDAAVEGAIAVYRKVSGRPFVNSSYDEVMT
jgi:glycosyltransferase involved in cell wall biosynthesis